jgi:L-lactate dehydrogenase complex protein LldG
VAARARTAGGLTSAREDILSNIRRSLAVRGNERTRRQIVAERLDRAAKGVIPERGQVSGDELVEVFRTQAELALSTVHMVDSVAEVPQAVAEFLRNHNLPAAIRVGEDLRLRALPWGDTTLEVTHGRSEGADLNAVSHAFGAVAESGTAVMVSGPENPSTLNFLPDNHIVVVAAKDIAGDYESVLARVRSTYGKGRMPRTVNFITGPSRSGDIEQTLLLGAHGPRRLHVVVVKG